jgi:hypothetical protein
MTYQTRRKLVRARHGVMFPIEDMGKPDFITGGYKYYGGSSYSKHGAIKERIIMCNYCGNEATHTAIFDGEGHKQIERMCEPCNKIHGPVNLKLHVV